MLKKHNFESNPVPPPGILTIIYNGEIIYAQKAEIKMGMINEKDTISKKALDHAMNKCPLIKKCDATNQFFGSVPQSN